MKFIDVVSEGSEYSINISHIVYYQLNSVYVDIKLSDGTLLKTETLYADFQKHLS